MSIKHAHLLLFIIRYLWKIIHILKKLQNVIPQKIRKFKGLHFF